MQHKRDRKAADLETRAAHNIATAHWMENLGPLSAEPSFTQELRDRADQWQQQAKRIRERPKRGKA